MPSSAEVSNKIGSVGAFYCEMPDGSKRAVITDPKGDKIFLFSSGKDPDPETGTQTPCHAYVPYNVFRTSPFRAKVEPFVEPGDIEEPFVSTFTLQPEVRVILGPLSNDANLRRAS